MGKIGRKVMWTVMGTAATTAVRRVTRGALHDRIGKPRLPTRARRRSGLGPALAWAAGAAAAMAVADVFAEQARQAASHR